MKYDVFISYSRKDMAIADQICDAFDNAGITYFIDRQGIGGGGEFPVEIEEAICDSFVFLFLASRNSYDSKYTKKEIYFAFNEKPEGFIIPYIIDDSKLPKGKGLKLPFSDINIRTIKSHPIESIVKDIQEKLPINQEEIKEESKEDGINPKPTIDIIETEDSDFKLEVKYRDGKWGFYDEDGNIAIPFIFDFASEFSNNRSCVKTNGKYGYINKSGSMVIQCIYEEALPFSDCRACVKLNQKYGIIDKNGNTIIPFKYDSPIHFVNNLAIVSKDGFLGGIDSQGKVILPFEYNLFFEYNPDLILANKDKKWGIIDKNGNIIKPFEFDEIDWVASDFKRPRLLKEFEINKIERGRFSSDRQIWRMKKNGNWCYYDINWNVVKPTSYTFHKNIDENLYLVGMSIHNTILDYDMFSKALSTVSRANSFDLLCEINHIRSYLGVINKNGSVVISIEYKYIGPFHDGVAIAIDSSTYRYVPIDFNDIFIDSLIETSNNRFGLIDINGNIVKPFKYQFIGNFSEGLAKAQYEDYPSYFFINLKGDRITYEEYIDAKDFSEGLAAVQLRYGHRTKWGYIDTSGTVVIPFQFSEAESFKEGKAKVTITKKLGGRTSFYIDKQGNRID